MDRAALWAWCKDKLLGPLIVFVIAAVLTFVTGLLSLPGRVERLEKHTESIPAIRETIGELKSDLTNFKKTSDDAAASVKDFNTKLLALGQANAELKGHVNELGKLSADLRDLRKSLDDLRVTVAALPANLKQEPARPDREAVREISTAIFLSGDNLKREGDVFLAQFPLPERLLAGRRVRDIRARLGTFFPPPGIATLSVIAEPQGGGFALVLIPNQPDAVARLLEKQPINVEVTYVVDR